MNKCTVEVISSIATFWTFTYGSWIVAGEILSGALTFVIFASAAMFFIVHAFRVPAPEFYDVERIVGRDPKDSVTNDYVMRVAAHRGAGMDAPENSLQAFQLCAQKGCDAVEFDLTTTADNVPVIFHDNTLERLTGSQYNVSDLTWDELSAYDISLKHPLKETFSKTRVATFDETIRQCLRMGQRMFIDVKDRNRNIVNVILEYYRKYPELHRKAVVSSFYPHVIYMVRRGNPKIVCSLAWRPFYFSAESYSLSEGKGVPRHEEWYKHIAMTVLDAFFDFALPRIIYYFLGISLILLHKDVISGKVVNEWRSKGVRVIAWTVNDPAEKQYCLKALKITYMTDTLDMERTK